MNIENKEINEACSKCFRDHGFRCVALSCHLGLRQSMKDYKIEFRLWHKVTRAENLMVIQNRQFANLRDHKHQLAFIVSHPLKDGFVIRKKVCSICRETYQTSLYRDRAEFQRLSEKMRG